MTALSAELVPAVLAHLGPGASWQSLLTTFSVGVAVVFILAVVGRVELNEIDDLILPLTVVAILSSVGPTASATLSDQVGWTFPLGVVALGALLTAVYTDVELTPRSRATWAAAVVAVGASVALQAPLTAAWHPPDTAGRGPGPTTQSTPAAAARTGPTR